MRNVLQSRGKNVKEIQAHNAALFRAEIASVCRNLELLDFVGKLNELTGQALVEVKLHVAVEELHAAAGFC